MKFDTYEKFKDHKIAKLNTWEILFFFFDCEIKYFEIDSLLDIEHFDDLAREIQKYFVTIKHRQKIFLKDPTFISSLI